MLHGIAAAQVRLDWCKLLHFFGSCCLLVRFVQMPVLNPLEEPFFIIVHHGVNLPIEPSEPVELHVVEVFHRNAADFRPRAVLKRIVVQEFGAQ